jgi:hypothetical protein
MADSVEAGPTEPTPEFTPQMRRYAPPPERKRYILILSALVACVLATGVYFMRRPTVKPAGNAVTVGNITPTSATISWNTDQPLASQVEYGTTPAYGSLSAFSASPVRSHSINLSALSPATTYNVAALSTDSAGHVTTSPNVSFTTGGVQAPGDTQASDGAAGHSTISRVAATDITTNSATITWSTDQPLTSQVEYGATPSYGSLSGFGSSPATSHSVKLTALTPGVTYNYAALSANSAGQVAASQNFTFTTASTSGMPVIGSVVVSGVTTDSATITWTTDQPSASQVEYGITTAYGSLSSYGSSLAASHSVTVYGLKRGTIYDFAAMSANAEGKVGKSANFTFTTAAGPPQVTQVAISRITSTSVTIAWTTDQPATSQVKYGTRSILRSLLRRSQNYESLSDNNASLVTSHSVTLNGLTPGTNYVYEVISANAAGIEGLSYNLKFATLAAGARFEKVRPGIGVGSETGDGFADTIYTEPQRRAVRKGIPGRADASL